MYTPYYSVVLELGKRQYRNAADFRIKSQNSDLRLGKTKENALSNFLLRNLGWSPEQVMSNQHGFLHHQP